MVWPQAWFGLICLVSTLDLAAAQDQSEVIDSSNPQIIRIGRWQEQGLPDSAILLDPNQARNGTWLYATQTPDLNPPSLSYSFTGSAIAVLGIVVRGVSQQPLGISIILDNESPQTPSYSPTNGATNGIDYRYTIFSKGGLSSNQHTVQINVTSIATPFVFDAIVIQRQLPGSSSSDISATSTPSATAEEPNSSNNAATLGGAIGGGVAAILLVIAFIWFFFKRVKSKEERQNLEAPRPFMDNRTVTTMTGTSQSRGPPSTYHSMASFPNPQQQPVFAAPPPSEISIPSEFQPISPTYQPTAVASSNLGTVPLPTVDLPSKAGTSRMPTIYASNENLNATPSSTNSALGLFSESSDAKSRSKKSLSRPLPLVPGTNRASAFTIPDEKKGLPLPLGTNNNPQ